MKTSETLYHRYEFIAKKYANRIHSYEQLSFEFEDLVQEFKIKIFTSIKAYGRRWSKYKRNEATKPVPLKYYLEAACSNKANDFMKYISRENYKTRIDEINYDFGIENDTNITPEENKFMVNGIDMLEGLIGIDKTIFSMFLRGYNVNKLNKVYRNSKAKQEGVKAIDIIEKQKKYLIDNHACELLQSKKMYSTYSFDED